MSEKILKYIHILSTELSKFNSCSGYEPLIKSIIFGNTIQLNKIAMGNLLNFVKSLTHFGFNI